MIKTKNNIRNTEIITGIFSILAGLALISTIITRFEFISFFSSLNEDLDYLLDNIQLLRINSVIWLITGLIITVSASTFIVLLNPWHKLFSWLTGFFMILTAAMISVSGIKGISIIEIVLHYQNLELSNSELLKLSIFTLAQEKELYIISSYSLLGFAFLSLGLFALRTRSMTILTGIVSIISGIILPVFTIMNKDSILADVGLVGGSITFMVIGVRILFNGLTLKKRSLKKASQQILDQA
ncbi:MAG: hypothetical protein K9H49_09270 [Bacteroidales bacterium]|nr:hypothetical protein [Bacteroidales bacterium]MCF8391558.1 hypothetical protein [Bacteroidales bacterium]